MEYRTQNRRSSWSQLESDDLSAFFHRDETYQARGRTGVPMASSTRKQGEPRRGTDTSAPSILKRRSSSHSKRHSVRFADQEREPVSRATGHLDAKWIWLPQEGTCALDVPGYEWEETLDVVEHQEMSGALQTEERRSTQPWRKSYINLMENMRNHRGADPDHETRIFTRDRTCSRQENKLFSLGDAHMNSSILRSPASVIDWITKGHDEGLRSRDILQDLTEILTKEL
ncbi:hypothetical protein MCOR25_005825 [Pyricularia grisea]|nr:hypothetical protein MCOR25_005825 [Pyricularia grisea]